MTVPSRPSSSPSPVQVADWVYKLPVVGGVISIGAEVGEFVGTELAGAIAGTTREGIDEVHQRNIEAGLAGLSKKQQAEAKKLREEAAAGLAASTKAVTDAIERLQKGPLYIGNTARLFADRHSDGTVRIFLQVRTQDKWESFLMIDDTGNVRIRGVLTENGAFDADGEEPQ